jgi:hypothetical protein
MRGYLTQRARRGRVRRSCQSWCMGGDTSNDQDEPPEDSRRQIGDSMKTRRITRAFAALPLVVGAVIFGWATDASAQPPNPDRASCVEQFNLAVGTPGEYQRSAHQDKLGRDVSFFARLSDEACPF